jgi:hypothetical protein
MSKVAITFLIGFFVHLTTFADIQVKLDPKLVDSKNLDHQALFFLNDFREDEDEFALQEINAAKSEMDAELAEKQYKINEKLALKQAIAEFDLKRSKKDAQVKAITAQIYALRLEERNMNLDLKKRFLESKLGKNPNLKETAQVFANQRKLKLNLGQLILKSATLDQKFQAYYYDLNSKLNKKNFSSFEDLLFVIRDLKTAEKSVQIMTDRIVLLKQNYEEAQAIADSL